MSRKQETPLPHCPDVPDNGVFVPEGLAGLLDRLGITVAHLKGRSLAWHEEATTLVPADEDRPDGYLLSPATAIAWRAMQAAAAGDGVQLQLVSAFRSHARQAALIERKRERGASLAEILRVLAVPGTSEHHSGRAIDLSTPGFPPADESFEASPAYVWLKENAAAFGFTQSFPRQNPQGYLFEPWHWCHDRAGLHPLAAG